MKINEVLLSESVGRIVQDVNTTADVDVNSTSTEAAKLGNKVDQDGRPPILQYNGKHQENSNEHTTRNIRRNEKRNSNHSS